MVIFRAHKHKPQPTRTHTNNPGNYRRWQLPRDGGVTETPKVIEHSQTCEHVFIRILLVQSKILQCQHKHRQPSNTKKPQTHHRPKTPHTHTLAQVWIICPHITLRTHPHHCGRIQTNQHASTTKYCAQMCSSFVFSCNIYVYLSHMYRDCCLALSKWNANAPKIIERRYRRLGIKDSARMDTFITHRFQTFLITLTCENIPVDVFTSSNRV